MTHIMILIAALNSLNVHGSKAKCEALIDPMIDLAISDVWAPYVPVHIEEDLKALKEFKQRCEKKGKK